MGPATEIAILPLKPGTNLDNDDVKAEWADILGTVKSQPGFSALFLGRQVESPDVVQILIGKLY